MYDSSTEQYYNKFWLEKTRQKEREIHGLAQVFSTTFLPSQLIRRLIVTARWQDKTEQDMVFLKSI